MFYFLNKSYLRPKEILLPVIPLSQRQHEHADQTFDQMVDPSPVCRSLFEPAAFPANGVPEGKREK